MEIYEDNLVTLHCGDCVEVMKEFDENSIDAIITDPPYGLEFMGKDWDKLNFHNSPDAKGNYPKSRNVRGVKLGMDIREPGDSNYTMNDTPRGRSKVRYSASPSYMVKKGKDGQTGRIDGKGGMDTWGDRPKYVAGEQMEEWHYQWAVEALRVVKPGGYLLAFGGTRTFHRLACAIEDAGFEFRDTVSWLYGSGFPKSLDVSKAIDKMKGVEREVIGRNPNSRENCDKSNTLYESGTVGKTDYITAPSTSEAKEWEGWGTALKPAWEPILVFRKPVEGTVAENVLKYGTGAMNIDECRVKTEDVLTHGGSLKPMSGDIREGKALGIFQDGTPNLYEQNPKGRSPANIMHDGSDEVEELFPESDGCRPHKITSQNEKYEGWGSITNKHGELIGFEGKGSVARFFYCAKADKGERDLGLELDEGEFMDEGREEGSPGGTNPRNRGAQTARKNFHPTVKPVELMKWLINLVSREDSLILDPFAGSGSTLVACKKLGRKVVGIEKDEGYCKITQKRLKAPLQKTFF